MPVFIHLLRICSARRACSSRALYTTNYVAIRCASVYDKPCGENACCVKKNLLVLSRACHGKWSYFILNERAHKRRVVFRID